MQKVAEYIFNNIHVCWLWDGENFIRMVEGAKSNPVAPEYIPHPDKCRTKYSKAVAEFAQKQLRGKTNE